MHLTLKSYLPLPPLQRVFESITYPTDSSSSVFAIVCSQDFKENVGISAIVGEFQETGEATHSKLQEQNEI